MPKLLSRQIHVCAIFPEASLPLPGRYGVRYSRKNCHLDPSARCTYHFDTTRSLPARCCTSAARRASFLLTIANEDIIAHDDCSHLREATMTTSTALLCNRSILCYVFTVLSQCMLSKSKSKMLKELPCAELALGR